MSVGQWYQDFSQVSDATVAEIINRNGDDRIPLPADLTKGTARHERA